MRQVTALLVGDLDDSHETARYRCGFLATLVSPWLVPLAEPRCLTNTERRALGSHIQIADWPRFTLDLRAGVLDGA
jgi:hypothetical protein